MSRARSKFFSAKGAVFAPQVLRSKSLCAHQRTRGFTLVELVIAFALLAMLTALLFSGFRYATRASDAGITRNALHEDMRRSHDFLRQHLEEMLPLRYQKELGKPLRFRGENDKLIYIAPVISRIAEGGVMWWELSLRSDSGGKKLALRRMAMRGDESAPPDFDAEKDNESVLAEGVQALKVSYFDQPDPALSGQWRESWTDDQRLPDLIKVEATLDKGRAWPELVIHPQLSPAIGCPGQWDTLNRRCNTLPQQPGLPGRG